MQQPNAPFRQRRSRRSSSVLDGSKGPLSQQLGDVSELKIDTTHFERDHRGIIDILDLQGIGIATTSPRSNIPIVEGSIVECDYLFCHGFVRWIGQPNGRLETFAGIELVERYGNCDGTYGDTRLFHCDTEFGIFIPLSDLRHFGPSTKVSLSSLAPPLSGLDERKSDLDLHSSPRFSEGLQYLRATAKQEFADEQYYKNRVIGSDMMPSLREIFEKVDVNGDGIISTEELTHYLKGLSLDKQSVDKFLNLMNLQASDHLDFTSFSSIISYILFAKFKNIKRRWPKNVTIEVFLGGACGSTEWRTSITVPILISKGVTFYNPQVEEWRPDMVVVEAIVKERCAVLLFVVGEETRGVASMIEAAQYICEGRHVVLVLKDTKVGSMIEGEQVSVSEARDLNRGRAYLADVAQRWAVPTFNAVEEATRAVVEIVERLRQGEG